MVPVCWDVNRYWPGSKENTSTFPSANITSDDSLQGLSDHFNYCCLQIGSQLGLYSGFSMCPDWPTTGTQILHGEKKKKKVGRATLFGGKILENTRGCRSGWDERSNRPTLFNITAVYGLHPIIFPAPGLTVCTVSSDPNAGVCAAGRCCFALHRWIRVWRLKPGSD